MCYEFYANHTQNVMLGAMYITYVVLIVYVCIIRMWRTFKFRANWMNAISIWAIFWIIVRLLLLSIGSEGGLRLNKNPKWNEMNGRIWNVWTWFCHSTPYIISFNRRKMDVSTQLVVLYWKLICLNDKMYSKHKHTHIIIIIIMSKSNWNLYK